MEVPIPNEPLAYLSQGIGILCLLLGGYDIFLPHISLLVSALLPGGFSLPQGWTWKAHLSLILL